MRSFMQEKNLVRAYMDSLENCSIAATVDMLKQFVSDDYSWEGSFPFMDLQGAKEVAATFWQPLKNSLKHMQRRQDVFMAGLAQDGKVWVTSMGQFMGLFDENFLSIPRTCKVQHLQYTEFSCIEKDKICHTALYVDLIGFMQEAGLRPLMEETGKYFVYPGPRDHNGLLFGDSDEKAAAQAMQAVETMIDDLYNLDVTKPETMRNAWADDMIWYGPCGVGSSYTIERYQKQMQMPFYKSLYDRKSLGRHAFFAEGDFVCFYTNLQLSSHGGWLGMAGGSKDIVLRGDLDIYYCKDGKIKENWCYFDIPYWLYQQGVNVLERTVGICSPSL